jgi:hypothetical protein
MTDEVKQPVREPKDNIGIPLKPIGFRPPPSTPMTSGRNDEEIRIASKIIDSSGDKLKEINLLPPGMVMDLICLSMFKYLLDHPEALAEQMVGQLEVEVLHYLRGRQGGFIKEIVKLAVKEFEVLQSNPNPGSYSNY